MFNLEHTAQGQSRLADIMAIQHLGTSGVDHGINAGSWMASFFAELGMPLRLRDIGVPQDDIPEIALDAMTDYGLRNNARPVSGPDDLLPLLTEMW